MEIDIIKEGPIILKLVVALMLGGAIGYDRERDGKSAGIRTYAAVCLGACLFTDIGLDLGDRASASRIIAYVISGIGFLGGGIIFKDTEGSGARGLTTAATVWCTAGVGVAIGMELFVTALVSTAAIYFLLSLHHRKWYVRLKSGVRKANGDDQGQSDL
ncbi:MgtC/SapB family protein [Mucilaginibacter sp. SMC90]|uniref:MgtC/SapB family protein n=1 Tax=Mucilaginibacter sp. SMC90 TaxID=2929803 RepID=UPI001FB20274|nr:MgtC/SapB family protein [Mucilaginibacter sp. SMC90]UOE49363.1 MgtC/SapB family protein [Mucilaginibacter sp. SMC90]